MREHELRASARDDAGASACVDRGVRGPGRPRRRVALGGPTAGDVPRPLRGARARQDVVGGQALAQEGLEPGDRRSAGPVDARDRPRRRPRRRSRVGGVERRALRTQALRLRQQRAMARPAVRAAQQSPRLRAVRPAVEVRHAPTGRAAAATSAAAAAAAAAGTAAAGAGAARARGRPRDARPGRRRTAGRVDQARADEGLRRQSRRVLRPGDAGSGQALPGAARAEGRRPRGQEDMGGIAVAA